MATKKSRTTRVTKELEEQIKFIKEYYGLKSYADAQREIARHTKVSIELEKIMSVLGWANPPKRKLK